MAKHSSAAYMTSGEQIAGVVFFVLYLLVLPLVSAPFFDLVQRLLGITLSASVRAMLYAYILFAVTVVIFHGYLAETTRRLVDGPCGADAGHGAGGDLRAQRAFLPIDKTGPCKPGEPE